MSATSDQFVMRQTDELAWQNSTDNGTVFALTADATLNLIVWGFLVLAIIVIMLEYARHRGDK